MLARLLLGLLAARGAPLQAQDSAQSPAARDLLAHADAPLFTAASVRLGGTKLTESNAPPAETAFTLTLLRSGRGRLEEGSGNTYRLQIFDGTTLSDYSAFTNSYAQNAARTAPASMLALMNLLRFGSDAWNIASAEVVRQESIDFGGQDTLCDVVRAAYNGAPGNPNARNVVRTVWIARGNTVIVRDSWESESPVPTGMAKGRTTYRYSNIQWDLPVADDLFVFHPSTGSRPVSAAPIPLMANGGGIGSTSPGGAMTGPSVRVTAPAVTHRVIPGYTPEARAARYQGTVLVSVEVDEQGHASQVRLVRGLGLGLDYQAVEAARQWQFTPGTRDGNPARMTRPFEVEFRMPDGGPWSLAGAVYRLIPPRTGQPLALTRPAVLHYASPERTACSGISYVAVHLHIDAKGMPSGVEAVQGPYATLGPAAVAAVQSWTFAPATANQKPIPADATVVLECDPPDSAQPDAAASQAVVHVGGGVSAPAVVFKVDPDYSEEARKAKFQGTVLLSLVVDAAGRPANLSVIRAVGLGLDEKALEAVAQWRFKPAMKDGKPVSVQSTVQVNFKLL